MEKEEERRRKIASLILEMSTASRARASLTYTPTHIQHARARTMSVKSGMTHAQGLLESTYTAVTLVN